MKLSADVFESCWTTFRYQTKDRHIPMPTPLSISNPHPPSYVNAGDQIKAHKYGGSSKKEDCDNEILWLVHARAESR
jgi:hypothetical protein